jgi:autophagy-related protein 18
MTIVEMLNETNIVLLVGLVDFGDFSPRNITMWNTNKSAVICKTQFEHPITLAKINNKYIIVVVLDKMHVYTLSKIERYHTFEIGYVVLGKLALSPSSDKNNYVCCSSNEGMVKVYDLTERCSKASIKAHKSPILKMVMNLKGDKLATCSCKGTIIRIFSVPKGEKIITYKRGVYSAYMFSLNFSFDDEKLITTSDTGTVHVFDLKADLKGEE